MKVEVVTLYLKNFKSIFVTEGTQYCVQGGLQQIKGIYANTEYNHYTIHPSQS